MGHFCAGTIINDYWILTAAHCFTFLKDPTDIKAQFGSNELYPKQPSIIDVTEVVQHEGYNPTIAVHDIALLKLKTSILKDKRAETVTISEISDLSPPTSNSLLIGWGLNETEGKLQNNLQKVELEVLSAEECRRVLPAFLHSTNFCAYGDGRGQCNGDSGGPLLVGNLQIGIVSWSLKPCAEYPGVFTNVALYRKWIDEKVFNRSTISH